LAEPPRTIELARLAGPRPPRADEASWGISPSPWESNRNLSIGC
jgi:hypothetical protein